MGSDATARETVEKLAGRLDELTAGLEALESKIDAIERVVTASKGVLRRDLVWQRQALESLLRHALLDPELIEYPEKLTSRRFSVFSQNGEDGLISAMLMEARPASKKFVELGCGINGGNSGFLAQELGWSGLMVDADKRSVATCRLLFPPARVAVAREWITRERVNALLAEHRLEGEVDLLSVDVDGNDIWIWEAIEQISARVVVIEYNASFGAHRAVAVPYDADFHRKKLRRDYFGASLAALAHIGKRLGYRLVAVEPRGANACFLRSDVAPHVPEAAVQNAFRVLRGTAWDTEPPGHRVRSYLDREAELYRYVTHEGLPLVEIDPTINR